MPIVPLTIVDEDDLVQNIFLRLAKGIQLDAKHLNGGIEALEFLSKNTVECLVLDINLPSQLSFQILEYLNNRPNPPQVIAITSLGNVDAAVKALKLGAYDYLTKPFTNLEKVKRTLQNALEKYRLLKEVKSYQRIEVEPAGFKEMVGNSEAMQEIYGLIRSIKKSSASVLIQGESGTGKELVARAIHATSPRAQEKFQVINCSAIPEALLESELFGHLKGAFTSAHQDKKGIFALANGGTLFLDEIGEVSPAFQVKLLRVLQNGDYQPLGSERTYHTDTRIIAATHQDLKSLIRQGKFREDLYFRLHIIGIHLPPLRNRLEDIPLLTDFFLKKMKAKLNKDLYSVTPDAMQALQSYDWPGNVRELENAIERAAVLTTSNQIRAKDLPTHILAGTFYQDQTTHQDLTDFCYQEAKQNALDQFNQNYICGLLNKAAGNITLASEKAGMDRSNFKKLIRKFKINPDQYKKN